MREISNTNTEDPLCELIKQSIILDMFGYVFDYVQLTHSDMQDVRDTPMKMMYIYCTKNVPYFDHLTNCRLCSPELFSYIKRDKEIPP